MADSFNHLPEIAAALPTLIGEILAKSALDIAGHAQTKAPVDTGALRASIAAEQTGASEWTVYSDKEYAPYQEFGAPAAHVPPHPYMRPAADLVKPELQAALDAVEGKLPQR